MQPYVLTLLFVFVLAPASAQNTALVAEAFCQCMQQPDERAPRLRAEDCLLKVARANEQWLRERLRLDPEKTNHRLRMADALVDELALNCPFLQTLDERRSPKLRWSDKKDEEADELAYQSPKKPPADPPEQVTAEAPRRWSVSGELLAPPARGDLKLLLADGRQFRGEIAQVLYRGKRLKAGDQVTVSYRREWRKAPISMVVNVVTRLER